MRPRTRIRVPKYLAPVARQLRDVENIIHKGAVIDSPTVKSELLPTGQVQLRARGKKAVVAGVAPLILVSLL